MGRPVPFLLTFEFDGGKELLRTAARLQTTARKFGFKPVWLVGVEGLRHPVALEPLARWAREGEAEVGALLEAGAVPPLVDLVGREPGYRPFLTEFPDSVLNEKLNYLTESLASAFGRSPQVIRCTRPAVDERYYAALARLGYKVDLTVTPHTRNAVADFTGYSERPYLTPQGVLEVPLTVRRRRFSPLVEDLLALKGWPGRLAAAAFPSQRVLRLGHAADTAVLVEEGLKQEVSHLDLRLAAADWPRGDRLVRDLERTLASAQTRAVGLGAEEFLLRYKNEELRKALV